jgi:superoxide dismutase, Cu-Zn family
MKTFHIGKAKVIGSKSYPSILGNISFTDAPLGVWVTAEFTGLPKTDSGFFGFHVHEGESCTQGDMPYYQQTLSHYNPKQRTHPMHAGDFPNVLATRRGYAKLFFLTDRFKVSDIIGKTVVLHLNPDDYHTQPSGGAGEKIACGKILPSIRL